MCDADLIAREPVRPFPLFIFMPLGGDRGGEGGEPSADEAFPLEER